MADAPWVWRLCANAWTEPTLAFSNPGEELPDDFGQFFSRIAKTLHGVWRGRVLGDDGEVGVDYYGITDVKRGEAQIIAQRSGKETMARFVAV